MSVKLLTRTWVATNFDEGIRRAAAETGERSVRFALALLDARLSLRAPITDLRETALATDLHGAVTTVGGRGRVAGG
jgi:hypothetical protein